MLFFVGLIKAALIWKMMLPLYTHSLCSSNFCLLYLHMQYDLDIGLRSLNNVVFTHRSPLSKNWINSAS